MNKQNIPQAFGRTKELLNMADRMGYRASTGSLRLKQQLGNSAAYTFQTVANVGTQLADEIRLLPGDAFIPVKLAMYIQKAAASPTDADQMKAIDRTYPNPLVFLTTESANLEALYKGKLIWNLNSTNIIEQMDTLQFRRVETAQQLVQMGSGTSAAGVFQRDGWNGGDYGMIPVQQDLCFNGAEKGTITLSLNNVAIDCTGSASVNYAVLQIRGIHLLNGAELFKDKTSLQFLRKGSKLSNQRG